MTADVAIIGLGYVGLPLAQDRKAANDSAVTAVSLVLFWPAAFMIRGNGESAAELGRLKGEMQAIEQANIQKNCGINFRRG